MQDRDTIITMLQTTTTQYRIRIQGEPEYETLERYQEAVEDTDNILDAICALSDEGANVLEQETAGTLMESFLEWDRTYLTPPLQPGEQLEITRTTTTVIRPGITP